MFQAQRKVIIVKNGVNGRGIAVFVPDTWNDFLNTASVCLNINARHVYNAKGCKLGTINLILNEKVLYIAEEEPFAPPNSPFTPDSTSTLDADAMECANAGEKFEDVMRLNIGGKYFETSSLAVLREPSLSKMLKTLAGKDRFGVTFIDRNPKYFQYILDYLRGGKLLFKDHTTAELVLNEAKFFCIDSLVDNWDYFTSCFEEYSSHSSTACSRKKFTKFSSVLTTVPLHEEEFKELGVVVQFNVGGKTFATTLSTLYKEPNSKLSKMVHPELHKKTGNVVEYFIDRDPTYFDCILNFLRYGNLEFRKQDVRSDLLLEEAKFYQIDSLVKNWDKFVSSFEKRYSREDLIRFIRLPETFYPDADGRSLRYLKFDAIDLSNLCFEDIDFQYSSFIGCRLVDTVFKYCSLDKVSFKGAFMKDSTFDQCSVFNSDWSDANMENVGFHSMSFINCNFKNSVWKKVNLTTLSGFICFDTCNFQDSSINDLSEASFKNCDLSRATLNVVYASEVLNSQFLHAQCIKFSSEKTLGCSFNFASLSDIEANETTDSQFSHANLSNFSFTDLINCDLSNANLKNVSGRQISNSLFLKTKINNLSFSNLIDCNFGEAIFNNDSIDKCEPEILNSRFHHAKLCNLSFMKLIGCDFSNASLRCVTAFEISNSQFQQAELSNLSFTKLIDSDLSKAILNDVSGCELLNSQFQHAELKNLSFTKLIDCNLSYAILNDVSGCELLNSQCLQTEINNSSISKLINCNFSGGILTGFCVKKDVVVTCDFTGASFDKSSFSDLYFSGDSLQGAILKRHQFKKCEFKDLSTFETVYAILSEGERNYFKNVNFTDCIFTKCCITLKCMTQVELKETIMDPDDLKEIIVV